MYERGDLKLSINDENETILSLHNSREERVIIGEVNEVDNLLKDLNTMRLLFLTTQEAKEV